MQNIDLLNKDSSLGTTGQVLPQSMQTSIIGRPGDASNKNRERIRISQKVVAKNSGHGGGNLEHNESQEAHLDMRGKNLSSKYQSVHDSGNIEGGGPSGGGFGTGERSPFRGGMPMDQSTLH